MTESVETHPASNTERFSMAAWAPLLGLVALLVAVVAIYPDTAFSMVFIWERSETYAHGFLIIPIAAWLLYRLRYRLAVTDIRPAPWVLILLAVGGFLWLLTELTGIQVGRQLMLVSLYLGMVLAVFGWRFGLRVFFPMVFLYFSVPMGESLIRPMMNFTADFTVRALELTGIPVYSEGLNFYLPTGSWSIVEGCSGVRYLIASITLGFLYAYLTYQKAWKQILFILLSAGLPVIANGVRAYMIVMIGHLSDMKLAAGVDHLIYGWVFFGFVMLFLFWLGSFWRDEEPDLPQSLKGEREHPVPVGRLLVTAVLGLAVLAIWPLMASNIAERQATTPPAMALGELAGENGWSLTDRRLSTWLPDYENPQVEYFRSYEKDGKRVDLFIEFFPRQQEGSEAVSSGNRLIVEKHPVWRQLWERSRTSEPEGKGFSVLHSALMSSSQRFLIWRWVWMSGDNTASALKAKMLEIRDLLVGKTAAGAGIVLLTPYEERSEKAEPVLEEFVRDMRPSIDRALADLSERVNAYIDSQQESR